MTIFTERLKKGLTQQQIADEIGVNRGSYSNWEKGKREPSFENLIKLADLLEVSLDWLFGRE
ncbi:Repressor protein C2 [Streptococcus pneumoniae]|nr:Repressor protein C2 [Streptococcus pneumoniae]CAG5161727.1 Repressor protein C2 [Streptococcus pneumoniae]